METVTDQSLSPRQAAQAELCSVCWAAPGTPCQRRSPEADHLARYLSAYQHGEITKAGMAAVFEAVQVVTRHRLVNAEVTK